MNFEFNWIHQETGKVHCDIKITCVCVYKIPFFKYALILRVISLTTFNSLFLVTLCFLWSLLEYDFDPGSSWWVERTSLVQMFMFADIHSFLPRLSQPFFFQQDYRSSLKSLLREGKLIDRLSLKYQAGNLSVAFEAPPLLVRKLVVLL